MFLKHSLIKVQSNLAKKNFQLFDQQSTNDRQVILKKESCISKPGGLDLSRSCLDRDSRSWQKKADLDTFKILGLTIEKSRSRSRILDFISTSMSRPKSRDAEICRDQKISAFLDSLSGSRVSQFYNISRSRFLYLSRFLGLMYLIKSQKCQDFSTNLAASWQISTNLAASRQILTISMRLDNLDKNLHTSKSRLKKSQF